MANALQMEHAGSSVHGTVRAPCRRPARLPCRRRLHPPEGDSWPTTGWKRGLTRRVFIQNTKAVSAKAEPARRTHQRRSLYEPMVPEFESGGGRRRRLDTGL